MRAAFKAVDSGYQVAVLVPTTILAEQHLRTFTPRMAEFPFTIRVAQPLLHAEGAEARFSKAWPRRRSTSSSARIGWLARRAVPEPGAGDHRRGAAVRRRSQGAAQAPAPDGRRADDDGHADPAHAAHVAAGRARHLATWKRRPNDRLAVETRVTRFDDELDPPRGPARAESRRADLLRPQPRATTSSWSPASCSGSCPEARIAIGHGQMPEGELEKVMLDFVEHGSTCCWRRRSSKAGSTFPTPTRSSSTRPTATAWPICTSFAAAWGGTSTAPTATCWSIRASIYAQRRRRRLRAIEEFSEMGAGFAIAMRDLEIRGAGNILGTQQSGHIATVGLRAVLPAAGASGCATQKTAAEENDRRRHRPAGRGVHSAELRARHAAKDRSLPPSSRGWRPKRNWKIYESSWLIDLALGRPRSSIC